MTAEEYIRLKPECLFIHNLDLLEHMLKADPKATAYNGTHRPYWEAHRTFIQEMERVIPVDNYRKIEEGFNKRLTTTEVPSDSGALNIDRYIGGDLLCFDEPVKRFRPRLSRTIIFDFGKNECENSGTDCQHRYEKIYKQVLECEERGEPCRVIAAEGHRFSEIRPKVLRVYIVVKDYNDPIFPAIWACIKTNRAAWALGNVIADFLVGTNDSTNGSATSFQIGDDIPKDEDVQIVDSVKIER